MESRLDSLFRTGFLPARETDTWQGIRREDPQDQHKNKNHHEHKDTPEEPGDLTVLSVAALRAFLKSLLPPEKTQATPEKPAPAKSVMPSTGATYAARAYAARAGGAEETPPPASQTGPAHALSAAEITTIRQLLEDVETLTRAGLGDITLRPAESFLQSLVNGVRTALQAGDTTRT